MEYMRQLEQRMEAVANTKWTTAVFAPPSK